MKAYIRTHMGIPPTIPKQVNLDVDDRETLHMIARTSVRTKLAGAFADQLAAIVLDAVLTVRVVDEKIDLHMVEIMHMKHKVRTDGN